MSAWLIRTGCEETRVNMRTIILPFDSVFNAHIADLMSIYRVYTTDVN